MRLICFIFFSLVCCSDTTHQCFSFCIWWSQLWSFRFCIFCLLYGKFISPWLLPGSHAYIYIYISIAHRHQRESPYQITFNVILKPLFNFFMRSKGHETRFVPILVMLAKYQVTSADFQSITSCFILYKKFKFRARIRMCDCSYSSVKIDISTIFHLVFPSTKHYSCKITIVNCLPFVHFFPVVFHQVLVAIVSILCLFILSSSLGFIGIWIALSIYMSLRTMSGFWR